MTNDDFQSELKFWKDKFYGVKTQNTAMKTLLRKMHREMLAEYVSSKDGDATSKKMYERIKEIERVTSSVNVRYYSRL